MASITQQRKLILSLREVEAMVRAAYPHFIAQTGSLSLKVSDIHGAEGLVLIQETVVDLDTHDLGELTDAGQSERTGDLPSNGHAPAEPPRPKQPRCKCGHRAHENHACLVRGCKCVTYRSSGDGAT